MDEAGHSGDSGASRSDSGGDSRDRALTNGWATPDSPWSNAGAALDPEDDDIASWRRPGEIRPFARRSFGADRPSGEVQQSSDVRPFAPPRGTDDVLRGYTDPGYPQPQPVEYPPPADHLQPTDFGPPAEPPQVAPARPSRFSDLLSRFPVSGGRGPTPPVSGGRGPAFPVSGGRGPAFPASGGHGPAAPAGGGRGPAAPVDPAPQPRPEPARPQPAQPVAPPPGFRSADAHGPADVVYRPADTPTSGFRPLNAPLNAPVNAPFNAPVNAPTSGLRPNDVPPPAPDPSAGVERRLGDMRNIDAPPPSSAPPYPYEGDLDDARRETSRPVGQQRTAVPLTRPFRPSGADVGQRDRPSGADVGQRDRPSGADVGQRDRFGGADIGQRDRFGGADVGQRDHLGAPDARRPDWNAPELARHAREPDTPGDGMPRVGSPPPPSHAEPAPPAAAPAPDAVQPRPSYDPSSFPRRLPYEGPFAGDPADRAADEAGTGLPQRVPAEPDVPTVPEPPSVEPTAETPQLARISEHLRRRDVVPADERQEGFDVNAIVQAVKEVDGVRDARLRATPQGAHSLRLDLAEGADPAEVSRQVARLLQERMGLDAAMKGAVGMPPMSVPPGPAEPSQTGMPPMPAPPGPAVPSQNGVSAPADGPASPVKQAPPPPAAGVAAVPGAANPRVPTQPIPAGRAPVSGGPGGAAQTQVIPTQQQSLPPRSRSGRAAPVPESAPVSGTGGPATLRGAGAIAPVSAPTAGKPPYVPGPSTTAETVPLGGELGGPRPLHIGESPGPRAVIENVQVTTSGIKAEVEVHLSAGGRMATGTAMGPSLDGYLLRLCAMAAADAIDGMLATSEHADGPPRCHIHHAAVVPFGSVQVAVVVVLLSCGSWVDQLAGSAVVTGDDGRAMVQATLAAVNRRLEALLS